MGGGILFLTFLMTMGACSESKTDDGPDTPDTGKVTLTVKAPQTRTSLENDSRVVWTQGDQVLVNGGWYDVTPDPADPTTALIVDVPTSDSYTAVYSPRSDMSTTRVTAFLPWEQPFATNSFADNINPMVAYSTSTNLSFKNLCGIIRLGITGSTQLVSAQFTDNTAQNLAGDLTLLRSRLESGDYTLQFGGESYRFISVDCTEAPSLTASPSYLYLVVPPRTYGQGFSVTLIDSEGNVCIRTTEKSVTVGRSEITDMEAFAFTADPTPVAVTAGEITATSIRATITAAPCGALRVNAIAKSLWESLLTSTSLTEAELMEQILLEGSFTRARPEGSTVETITTAYTRNGSTSLTADTDYYIVAGYNAGRHIAGAVKIATRTSAAQGDAPTLAFAGKTPTERPYAKSILNIVSNGRSIRFCHMSGAEYDELKTTADDAQIVSDRGSELSTSDILGANSAEGCDLFFDFLTSETRYVLLATATSAGGATTTDRFEYTTPPYLDPSAVWTTISTSSRWEGSDQLLQYWNYFGSNLENITVQQMAGSSIYRLVNVFRTQSILEAGFIPTSDAPSYLIVDATNPYNVVIEPYENNLGINNISMDGDPKRWTASMLFGSASFYQGGGEPGRIEQTDEIETRINLGIVIIHGTDASGDPYQTHTMHGGMLIIRRNTFTGTGTENFRKNDTPTPW